MKKREIIIFASIFVIALVSIVVMGLVPRADTKTVIISVDGQEYKRIEIDTQTVASFTIDTEHGQNHVVIENGTVNVIAADCPNQICVNTKAARRPGDIIVCLPHKVVIEIVEN